MQNHPPVQLKPGDTLEARAWQLGCVLSVNATFSVATYTYLNVANYTATVQVHDSSGCFAQSQVGIEVLAIPEFAKSIFVVLAVGLVLVLTFSNKSRRKQRMN